MAVSSLTFDRMVQALWYVRKSGQVRGPFPGPQIEELLRSGEIAPSDELSLDAEQWLPVRESGLFHGKPHPAKPAQSGVEGAWLDEREKARVRWEEGVEASAEALDDASVPDARRIESLRANHEATRAMLDAEASRRPSLLIAMVGLLVLVLAGLLIWFGQGEDTLQTSIGKVSDCHAAPASGVSWSACDKSGISLTGADLQSMILSRSRFDGATLAGVNLSYADLSRASLRGANLAGANLTGANLDGADLTGADLTRADLRYASFKQALIEGVRFDQVVVGKTTWVGGQLCDRLDQCR
jgi:hypothetical protein